MKERTIITVIGASSCAILAGIAVYDIGAYACTLAAPTGGGSFPCQPASFNPSNPGASGYVKVFSDDFRVVGTSTINQSTAPTSGTWHWSTHLPFGGDIVAGELSTDSNGLVLNASRANFNSEIVTAANLSGGGWVGHVFRGGGYFEAVMSFDGASVNTGVGWPSFWSMAVEHTSSPRNDQWPGQAVGYEHFIEDDFFEYDTASFAGAGSWGSAEHDWYGNPPNNKISNDGAGGSPYNNFAQVKPGGGVTWNAATFHTVGHIWVKGDANNGNNGFVQTYIDGVASVPNNGANGNSSKVGWTDGGITTPAALPNSTAVFSIQDQDGLNVQIGGGQGQPFHIQQVNIWMIPGCGTMVTQ